MSEANKTALMNANAAIAEGDIEGFLSHCTEDIVWLAVGEPPIHGKAALREWMRRAYAERPEFSVERLVAEDDWVVALGDIQVKGDDGRSTRHLYSDAWRFREGQMAELRAFVIRPEG
jgi:ketosteroid isomerase-like protein